MRNRFVTFGIFAAVVAGVSWRTTSVVESWRTTSVVRSVTDGDISGQTAPAAKKPVPAALAGGVPRLTKAHQLRDNLPGSSVCTAGDDELSGGVMFLMIFWPQRWSFTWR